MEYLVMETHQAYAVVVNDKGAFIKAANLGYSVGDRVQNIVPADIKPQRSRSKARIAIIAAAAACLCILYFGAFSPNFMPYGTVRMTINPDVLMTVSRTGRVLKVQGLNGDGEKLLEGYSYKSKHSNVAALELMNKASKQNYLKDGGKVKLTIASKNDVWEAQQGEALSKRMDDGVKGKTVTIFISYEGEETPDTVIATDGSQHKAYTYDEWVNEQNASGNNDPGTQSPAQWGASTGEKYEKWGVATGDKFQKWGESVGSIFADGFDGKKDIDALFGKLGELVK